MKYATGRVPAQCKWDTHDKWDAQHKIASGVPGRRCTDNLLWVVIVLLATALLVCYSPATAPPPQSVCAYRLNPVGKPTLGLNINWPVLIFTLTDAGAGRKTRLQAGRA
jgi:hypothetical protein